MKIEGIQHAPLSVTALGCWAWFKFWDYDKVYQFFIHKFYGQCSFSIHPVAVNGRNTTLVTFHSFLLYIMSQSFNFTLPSAFSDSTLNISAKAFKAGNPNDFYSVSVPRLCSGVIFLTDEMKREAIWHG